MLSYICLYSAIKGGGPRKKTEKVWSFAKLGGGVSEGSKKTNLYFGKACRIILGPKKHVLHLVPSPDAVAKAFNVM